MPDNGDDSVTVVTGYFTLGADEDDVDAIRDALQECGYAVEIDREDGAITVQHAPDRSERSDEDDAEDKEMTKREQRIQRLQDGIEDGEAYTSDELCAIAYDIDASEVGTSKQAYVAKLRGNGDIDIQTMPDPHRGGNAKLYYRGERPEVAEPAEQEQEDTDAEEEQEIEEMQEDLYQDDEPDDPELPKPEPEPDEPVPTGTETGDDEDEDDEDSEDEFTCTACGQQFDTFHGLRDHHCETGDFPCPECDKAFDDDEALQNHLRDKHPGFYGDAPVTHAGTDEDADDGEDDEELLDEMGPCNIGKIMIRGEFERYVCQECDRTFHDESAADAHADDANHPTFKAYNQRPEKEKQPAGFVGGGTAR